MTRSSNTRKTARIIKYSTGNYEAVVTEVTEDGRYMTSLWEEWARSDYDNGRLDFSPKRHAESETIEDAMNAHQAYIDDVIDRRRRGF